MQVKRAQKQLAFLVDVAKFDLEHRFFDEPDEEDLVIGSLFVPRVVSTRVFSDQFDLDVLDQLSDQYTAPFPVRFGRAVLSFLLDLDTTATHARFVSGIELLAGFLSTGNNIPIQRFVDGHLVYEDPTSVRAGGLIRITIAMALKAFKAAVLHLLRTADVQFQVQQTNRPDLRLCAAQWSLFLGWPDQCEVLVGKKVRSWFETRRHRRACDLARPLPWLIICYPIRVAMCSSSRATHHYCRKRTRLPCENKK